MKTYELKPSQNQSQISFYGKATVIEENGCKTLYSYGTKIMTIKGKTMFRHYNDWTQTTGKHIFAFSGLRKADFFNLKLKLN